MKSTRRRLRRICMIAWNVRLFPRAYDFWNVRAAWNAHARCGRLIGARVINCAFDQTIVACDSRLSFACLFLFPKSTKVSFGDPYLDFENALSRAIMLTLILVCAFSPRVHNIPRGPRLEVFRKDKSALHGSEQRALPRRRNMRCTWKYNSPKAQKKSPIARWFFFC